MTEENKPPSERIKNTERYIPSEIEAYWQHKWNESNLYKTKDPVGEQKTFYALSMFPYPSGNLHMGHVRNYVITDVIARYKKMKGMAVLHPMGWDSFGLPAENAAIERGINPETWTSQNIKHMKAQLSTLGLSIDWNREITTSSSEYYKWTQYIFLQLFKKGLAYQKQATVNWDPVDNTVLANEQVDSEGKSWRSGALVEKKQLEQWFLKITDYAEDLLNDLTSLDMWPEKVRAMQRNWIGKSQGLEIDFVINNPSSHKLTVFTTRADTLAGVSYIAVAPESDYASKICNEHYAQLLKDYLLNTSKLSSIERSSEDRSKTGFYTGIDAINPINGDTVPIWVADYVLNEYGSGAVMGVPCHDIRDNKFATKYNLKTKIVILDPERDEIALKANQTKLYNQELNYCYTGNGTIINSGIYDGLDNIKAKKAISDFAVTKKWGRYTTTYKLRDWLISRQRIWGAPIPIINCKSCGNVPVPATDLPVLLPKSSQDLKDSCLRLQDNKEWISVSCPNCGIQAERETDTMDTFMCSSWYFLRYTDSNNFIKPFDKNTVSKWLPVDQYVGGIEHAILHLLYSRFLTKALKDIGLISMNEPFNRLLTQGMVQSLTYKCKDTGKYIRSDNVITGEYPIDKTNGNKLEVIYEKMSKSKFNGVDPSTVVNKYGADTARMFILFKAPPEKDLEWDDADVEGQFRFLQRIWKLTERYLSKEQESNIIKASKSDSLKENTSSQSEVNYRVNVAIKEISSDIGETLQLNTAISELMKLVNCLNDNLDDISFELSKSSIYTLMKLLSPFAPHISEHIWHKLGNSGSIHNENWPVFSQDLIVRDTYSLVIQIKGKVRGTITVPTKLSKDELANIAIGSEIAKKWIGDLTPSRVIVIPGKLVNLVP